MQDPFYPLEPPAEKVVVKRVNKFMITNLSITLFKNASMMAMLYDVDDKLIDGLFLTMSEEVYLDWNNSDTFLVDWVAQQIRLQYDVKVIEESHVKLIIEELIIEELIIEEPIIAENILSL